jgi:hemerythrin-like metal-binding protein
MTRAASRRKQGEGMHNPPPPHRLGIPEMDAQHDYLYGLFERLEDGPVVTDRHATAALLAELQGYLLFHFESEEHFVRLYQAPGFALHQGDHEQTGTRVVQFLDDFDEGKLNPGLLKRFLTGWLREHSRTIDEEYARFVRKVRGG